MESELKKGLITYVVLVDRLSSLSLVHFIDLDWHTQALVEFSFVLLF